MLKAGAGKEVMKDLKDTLSNELISKYQYSYDSPALNQINLKTVGRVFDSIQFRLNFYI